MSLIAERLDIKATTGDLKAVSARLKADKPEMVVAISLSHLQPETLAALGKSLETAAYLLLDQMLRNHDEALEKIVSLLVPQQPIDPIGVKEAQMRAAAKRAVLESGDWLTAAQVAQLAGFTSRNASSQPNKWKQDGRIFAIRHNDSDYYPNFALEEDNAFRPLPVVGAILKVFQGHKDEWKLAYWFASASSYLGGKRPQDLLTSEPEKVISAAEDEVVGVTHG